MAHGSSLAQLANFEMDISNSDRSLLNEEAADEAATRPSFEHVNSQLLRVDGDDDDDDGGGGSPQLSMGDSEHTAPASNITSNVAKPKKRGGILKKKLGSFNKKNKPPSPTKAGHSMDPGRTRQLTAVSKMYDLDGDGELNPIEQAMRNRDLDGDGCLDNAEVCRIVQDQLRSEQDFGLYRKVAAGLLCLVAILALSNFGTSWATAILTKEVSTDSDTATILDKATQEVMGYQQVAHSIEMQELTNDEFTERRRLVDEALMEDVDHGDHAHRRLGKKKDNFCTCTQIAYDHNKIDERDLEGLVKKCDGANTVNMRRRWRNRDGTSDEDYDTICGPGTVVVRKQKKKKNKNKTKTKLIDERVTFRKKGRNGEDKSINFDCDGRGSCYTSGETLLQGLGHPCDPWRDLEGASECESGLVCHDPAGSGSGTCIELQRYSRKDQVCDVDYGVDACVSGYSCKSTRINTSSGKGKQKRSRFELQVNVGTCTKVKKKSKELEVCDASFGENACDPGYVCLGSNGIEISRGIGYCFRAGRSGGGGGGSNNPYRDWYVTSEINQCVRSCKSGPYCAGRAENWEEIYESAEQCCELQLGWMNKRDCVPDYDWREQ